MLHFFQIKALQAQILVVDPLAAVFAVLAAIVAVKLHVPDHALQLVLDRALEVVLGLAIILVQELVVVVVMGAQVVQEIAKDALAVPETVDLVVMVAVMVPVMVVRLPVQILVEPVVADSAEVVASSMESDGGFICAMYM